MRVRRKRRAVAVLAATATIAALILNAGAAMAETGSGTVTVNIAGPDGVPANVLLHGKTEFVAAKPPAGTGVTVSLAMAAGTYHVNLPAIQFGGARYVGQSSIPEVIVQNGLKTTVTATYAAEGGAHDLHVTSLNQTSLGLAWAAPDGWTFALRRATGATAPQTVDDGVAVATSAATAVDSGLSPGTRYLYSLFAKNHSRWYGPLVVSVTTAPPAGSMNASYVAEPSTFIGAAGDFASVAPTGNGARAVLNARVATPLLGAAVLVPILPSLPGGYLGVVNGVSSDGRTLDLVAGGLSDAFDYYDLSVDPFTTDAAILPAPSGATATTPSAKTSAAPLKKPATRGKSGKIATGATGAATTAAPMAAAAAPPPNASNVECGDVSASQKVTYSPSLALGGHFNTRLDKYHFLVDIPVGASLDMALTVKAVGAASIETSGEYACGLKLDKIFKTVSLEPIPMSVLFEPTVDVSVSGALEVSNIGATVTGGVQVSGSLSVKNGASFTGSAILNSSPLTPDVKANGEIGLKVGGELTFGPGVGTPDAGVIAGVKGEIDPLVASYKAEFPVGDPKFNLCSEFKAAFTAGLSLTAKAWLNNWSLSKDITLDALNGTLNYPGSPWEFPEGCAQAGGTPDSLLGPGVTKVNDSTTGSPDQWGHLDGFVPGQKTWVLSTGLVDDAVGTPDEFASTDLGLPGDADLSTLAGFPTHDATSYEVTVVPSASNLHVRYVFASEEYPEFVGSQYNDVMAVYVNGHNCAFVPGTTTPVSINTINAGTNSAYYIDNSTGAAGYHTTMDGLTVPLTCTVSVTPGVPVTIRIAVADTSDAIYDSAVALVDGGIWTD